MTSFEVTQQDLLLMSLVAHGCLLVQLVLDKVISKLAPLLTTQSSMMRTLMELHEDRPGLLSRILMEQLTLWTLVILILVSLTYTSLPLQPYSHQPLPYPSFLIRLILSISVARFLVMGARTALLPDLLKGGRRSYKGTSGQSGHLWLDLVYSLFSAITNLLCLGYHQNLLLGVTSSFMEVSSTPLECRRLIKLARKQHGSKSYKKTTILSCALCCFFRVALPVIFLTLASCQESPTAMDELPMTWFFLSAIFYMAFNLCLVSQSIRQVGQVMRSPTGNSLGCLSSTPPPFSTHAHTETSPGAAGEHKHNDSYHHLNELNLPRCESSDKAHAGGQKADGSKRKELSKHNLLSKIVRAGDEGFPRAFHLSGRFCKNMGRTSSNDYLLKCPSEAGDQDDLDPLGSPGLASDREDQHYGAVEDSRKEVNGLSGQDQAERTVWLTAVGASEQLPETDAASTTWHQSELGLGTAVSVASSLGPVGVHTAAKVAHSPTPWESLERRGVDVRSTHEKRTERGCSPIRYRHSLVAPASSDGVSVEKQVDDWANPFALSTICDSILREGVEQSEVFSPADFGT